MLRSLKPPVTSLDVEPGDVLADGREALVTAPVEAGPGPLAALLGRPRSR
jgi:hypothetical protein